MRPSQPDICKEHRDIVLAWFENHVSCRLAFQMEKFIRYGPEEGWRIVLRLLERAGSAEEREDAAGELLLLLMFHGDRFIARAEALAVEDASFQDALREIRASSWGMSFDTWSRLNAAAGAPLLPPERFDGRRPNPAPTLEEMGLDKEFPDPEEREKVRPEIERMLAQSPIEPRNAEERALAVLHPSEEDVEAMVDARLTYARTFWACEVFMNAVIQENGDPTATWHLVLDLVAGAPSEDALGAVAAGPLEDFLSTWGEEYIDEVERLAAADPRFQLTLRGVWQLGMSDALYARVQKAAGEGAAM